MKGWRLNHLTNEPFNTSLSLDSDVLLERSLTELRLVLVVIGGFEPPNNGFKDRPLNLLSI